MNVTKVILVIFTYYVVVADVVTSTVVDNSTLLSEEKSMKKLSRKRRYIVFPVGSSFSVNSLFFFSMIFFFDIQTRTSNSSTCDRMTILSQFFGKMIREPKSNVCRWSSYQVSRTTIVIKYFFSAAFVEKGFLCTYYEISRILSANEIFSNEIKLI